MQIHFGCVPAAQHSGTASLIISEYRLSLRTPMCPWERAGSWGIPPQLGQLRPTPCRDRKGTGQGLGRAWAGQAGHSLLPSLVKGSANQ